MPFGGGPRVCIGQSFAMLEVTLLAALLLQRYELHMAPEEAPPEPELNVTLRPRWPLRLRLLRRPTSFTQPPRNTPEGHLESAPS